MKLLTSLIMLLTLTVNAHAGWIIAGDSLDHGVIKTSRSVDGDMKIELCPYIYADKCTLYSEIGTLGEVYETAENITQTTLAGFSHAFLALVATIVPQAISLGPALGAAGFAIGGEVVISKLKSANILRQADYVKIYTNSFIESDKDIISLPDDRVADILSDL